MQGCITLERQCWTELGSPGATSEQSTGLYMSRAYHCLMIKASWCVSWPVAECGGWERKQSSHNTVNVQPAPNPPAEAATQIQVTQHAFSCPTGSSLDWDQMYQFSRRKAARAILGTAWSSKHPKSYLIQCLDATDLFIRVLSLGFSSSAGSDNHLTSKAQFNHNPVSHPSQLHPSLMFSFWKCVSFYA